MFFLIFLFDRSSSFRNDFACANAPNRSVNRYDALKLLLCFGSSCHGVVIGHALHPVTLAILLHMLLFYLMCFGTFCHGVFIGHALYPVTLAELLHMFTFPVLRHFLAYYQ